MGRLFKETVAVPIRVKQELLELIDGLLYEDPCFSSRAEFVLFCLQRAYGDVIEDTILRLTAFKEERTQGVFDQIMKDKLTKVSITVGKSCLLFDQFEGPPSIIQVRMNVEFLEQLDLLCSMLSVKRVDFFKYSIIEFGAIYGRFDLKRESLKVSRTGSDDDFIELKMGEAWRKSISEEVESNVKSARQRSGFRG